MLVNLIKIISGICLVAVLYFVTNHREIIFKPKTALQKGASLQQQDPVLPEVTQVKELPTVTNEPTSAPTQAQPTPMADTPKIFQQEKTPTPVAAITTKSQYVVMQEGQSDTDDTYRPSLSPCKVTMGYKIGRFDQNFGISKEKFIQKEKGDK